MNLSAPFIARPVATTLLSIGLALAGGLAYLQLPVAPLPQVDFPTISVQANLPGASPETMAATVATPLERVLGNIAGVTEMTSSSSQGSTRVTLQFELHRDVNGAARDVQAAINTAQALLPTGMPSRPTYKKVNPADSPMLVLALTSDTYTRGQMYDMASTTLAQRLAQVDGVGQVTLGGGALPAVRIELDPNKLLSHGVSLEMVRQAVVASNAHRPKGLVEDETQAWQIEANDQARSAQDYAPLILRYVNGQALRLQDVAQVQDSVQNVRTDGVSQGQPAVLLVLNLQPGGNVIETVDRVRGILPMLQDALPAAVKMTVVSDRSPTVRASLSEIQKSLALSMALVILVVGLFLKRWQTALIPAVALPLSLAGTCVVMYLMGLSLNNLTLMALTIATGFVVDDAIVVLENITRLRERGMPLLQACLEGSREIGFTVVAISISLVAVFIPILFMGGVLGRLFSEFAVVMTAAIGVSMVVSLTTTPMMCAALLPQQTKPQGAPRRSKSLRGYRRGLAWALRHPGWMWLILVVAVVLNVTLYRDIPKGFFPQQDTGRINGYIRADQSSSFQAMQQRLHTMLAIVQADPAVETVTGFTGEGQRNAARMFLTLKPRDQRDASAEQVVARLRARLSKEAGARLFLTPVQDIRVGARVSNSEYEFTIKADDLTQLREWEPKLRRALGKLKELEDVSNDYEERGLQTSLVIDRDAAARLGLSVRDIDTVLANAFSQRQIGVIYNPLNQYRVVLTLAPPYVESAESLRRLQFINDKGQAVPLSGFARIELTNTALSVSHEGGVPSDTFSFSLAPGVSLSQATQAIDEAVAQLNLPVSVRGSFAGTANAFQRSLVTQPLLIAAALLTLYMVLGMLYENLLHPLTILSTLPSAGLGALLTLMAMGTEFSIIAMIGVILLIGIVKKNAILMIDLALQQQGRGRSAAQAIYIAAQMRLRPIVMTTAAAMLGAIPLALAQGVGAELRQPLGLAVLGGLVLSQLLTLFTTPIVFVGLEALRRVPLKKMGQSLALGAVFLGLSGCSSWFKPPAVITKPVPRVPAAFAAVQSPSLEGDAVDRAWWTLFQDPVLNDLQQQLESGNVNLQVLSAKVRQAQASLATAQSSLFPSVNLNAGANRGTSTAGGAASNSISVGLPLTWEIDVWGRIDAQTQVAQANVQASREDMALARLSAQATLVQTYIALRSAERQQAVLEKAQAAYERALTLTRYRYEAGVVSAGDVAQAESQWHSAVALGMDVQTTRQQLSHSVAVLLGLSPSALQLASTQALPSLPALPQLLPATVLQRRPDIRAAELRVMAAQAQLGVAQTAAFPTFSFTASTGYKSTDLASLLSASSRLWSLGPSLALSLFDGGQRQAAQDDAKAALEVAALNYQQAVLNALQEVEDNLVAAHQLQLQEAAQAQALQAAERNLRITEAQYAAGTVSYLNVVTAQASALTAQRNVLDVQSRRALAVTALLKNLGGRWDTTQ